MIPIFCYPETHFRFGGISPSLLFKKEPEIIFDTPARHIQNTPLPLFLLLHNIDKYPIEVLSIEIGLFQKGEREQFVLDTLENYSVTHPSQKWTKAYNIPINISDFSEGRLSITPIIEYQCRGKKRRVVTDNLRTTSHTPLTTYLTKSAYPGSEECFYGDMHCHSIHSRSHVEFGAPIPFYREAAKSSGLSLVSIIDHTYDLGAKPENYLHRDVELKNWFHQQSQKDEDFPLLMISQEHSARKRKGGVVHMGVLGYDNYLAGSGDGARKGYDRNVEPSLEEASTMVTNAGGVTFAAHPGEPTTLMQRIFLRRDNWKTEDFTDAISAIQALNRGIDSGWYRARKMWIQLLLQGKRIPLLAGNDAHGDFNRYRAIAYPFIVLREDMHRYFGLARTGFYSNQCTHDSLLNCIKRGETFITTGPFIDIQQKGESIVSSQKSNRADEVVVVSHSSEEFGTIKRVRLHCHIKSNEEVFLLPVADDEYHIQVTIPSNIIAESSYIRVEVETKCGANGLESFAATSPAYFV